MADALVGGAFLSAFLQVLFDRMASHELEEILGRLEFLAKQRDLLDLKEGGGEKFSQKRPTTYLVEESGEAALVLCLKKALAVWTEVGILSQVLLDEQPSGCTKMGNTTSIRIVKLMLIFFQQHRSENLALKTTYIRTKGLEEEYFPEREFDEEKATRSRMQK
ncbi:hypothetical protein CFP56_025499 [Quercus suber]|uniref:Uncharacterized protein n=1 Tax=Quercus suber TaxID=58331 RepID=A0AAW0LXA9_QUESU